ncbi:phosphodiesterase [Sphingomonas sp. ASV193]|uniref:phosphodiesterase n=1 Tax=Sphingomonas sp. ASV193 TaxID=3144405 RepID=UPI0032E91898
MTVGEHRPGALIAQITDLHIGFDRGNPHELNVRRLSMVIDRLNAMTPRPTLLIVSGDIVEWPDDIDAYRHAKALVARFEGPVAWAMGNHDGREAFAAVFPEVPSDPHGFVQYELDHGGLRWLMLDTLDDARHGGMLCTKRIGWLKARLAERRRDPTVIVLHHPPVDTGIDWMSALSGEKWVRRLHRAISPARQVVGLLAGHVHRPIATSFAGRTLAVVPSTAPGLALDLDDIDPAHPDNRPLILLDSPHYALHYWNGERLLTHFDRAEPDNALARYTSNLQPMIREFLTERGTG